VSLRWLGSGCRHLTRPSPTAPAVDGGTGDSGASVNPVVGAVVVDGGGVEVLVEVCGSVTIVFVFVFVFVVVAVFVFAVVVAVVFGVAVVVVVDAVISVLVVEKLPL